jgi:bacteriocin biosynthesis cyclodehydratase domain-containing protein
VERFCLKRGVHWVNSDQDIALFFHYGSRFLIQGRFVRELLSPLIEFLREPRARDKIFGRFSSFPESDTANALKALRSAGFLETLDNETGPMLEPSPGEERVLGFLGHFLRSGASPSLTTLRNERILVINAGSSVAPDFLEALQGLCFKNVEVLEAEAAHAKAAISPEGIAVVLGSWYRMDTMRELNRVFLASRRRWLCVIEDYFGGAVGPYLGLPDGPCLDCLFERRAARMRRYDQYLRCSEYFGENPEKLDLGFPAFSKPLAQAAALEVLKLLFEPVQTKLHRGLFEFDFLNHRSEFYPILPLPGCKACL